MPVNYQQLFLFSTVFTLLFALLSYNRRTALISGGVFILSVVILIVLTQTNRIELGWLGSFQEQGSSLINFLFLQGEYQNNIDQLFALLITAALSLYSIANLFIRFHFIFLVAMGGIIFVAPETLGFGTYQPALMIFVILLIVLIITRTQLFAQDKKQNKYHYSLSTLMVVPMAILLVVVSNFFPRPAVATYGETIPELLSELTDGALGNTGTLVASLSSDGKNLDGELIQNDDLIMTVSSDYPIYLSGVFLDTYTGKSWENSLQDSSPLAPEPATQYSGTSPYSAENYNRYFDLVLSEGFSVFNPIEDNATLAEQKEAMFQMYSRQVVIQMGENRTKTIFTPSYRENLYSSEPIQIFEEESSALFTKKLTPKGLEYYQDYLYLNFSNSLFLPALQSQPALAPEEYPPELQVYLTLPDDLPPRVEQLAQSITADQENSYDKVKALEEYLKQFPYTTNPPVRPADQDFVDFFLFDSQQGYCVHYATSLAILVRCIGLPTRYVEGYVTPTSRNSSGDYLVTNRQAHAWTEVYFPDFGWVRFEPTSSYAQPIIVASQSPSSQENFVAPQDVIEQSEAENPPSTANNNEQVLTPEPDDPAQINPEQEEPQPSPFPIWLMVLLVIVAVSLILFILYRYFMTRKQKRQAIWEELTVRQKSVSLIEKYLKALKFYGYQKWDNESIYQYLERIYTEPNLGESFPKFQELSEIISRVLYSEEEIDNNDLEPLQLAYDTLLKQPKNNILSRLYDCLLHQVLDIY